MKGEIIFRFKLLQIKSVTKNVGAVIQSVIWGCRGRNRMVVGFTTTYKIGAYHH